jgi:hypothetical protein
MPSFSAATIKIFGELLIGKDGSKGVSPREEAFFGFEIGLIRLDCQKYVKKQAFFDGYKNKSKK